MRLLPGVQSGASEVAENRKGNINKTISNVCSRYSTSESLLEYIIRMVKILAWIITFFKHVLDNIGK